MSDSENSPLLKRIEKTLERMVQFIRSVINVRSTVIIVVHEDGTTQSSAAVAPGLEDRTAFALRQMAEKIQKHEGVKVQMSQRFKN